MEQLKYLNGDYELFTIYLFLIHEIIEGPAEIKTFFIKFLYNYKYNVIIQQNEKNHVFLRVGCAGVIKKGMKN